MGLRRDAEIAEWRERAGLTEHTPDERAWLRVLKSCVRDLSEMLMLEESGIRDGDGSWCGSDPVDGALQKIAELHEQRRKYRASEPELWADDEPHVREWDQYRIEKSPEGEQ